MDTKGMVYLVENPEGYVAYSKVATVNVSGIQTAQLFSLLNSSETHCLYCSYVLRYKFTCKMLLIVRYSCSQPSCAPFKIKSQVFMLVGKALSLLLLSFRCSGPSNLPVILPTLKFKHTLNSRPL